MHLIIEEHGDVDVVGVRTTETVRETVTLSPCEEVRGVLHGHAEQLTGTLSQGGWQVVHRVLTQDEQ